MHVILKKKNQLYSVLEKKKKHVLRFKILSIHPCLFPLEKSRKNKESKTVGNNSTAPNTSQNRTML